VNSRLFQTAGYAVALALCLLAAFLAGWTTLGTQIDNDAYDFFFRLRPPRAGAIESAVLAVDERTLSAQGGMRRLRGILAEGLERLSAAGPKVVVVDLNLADAADSGQEARLENAHLESSFARTKNLVLASELVAGRWEDPTPAFRRHAAALGHVHADPDPYDNVTRSISLEKASGHERRWALALEAFRLARGAGSIEESPDTLQTGGRLIPAARSQARPLLIRFLPRPEAGRSGIPHYSLLDLKSDPQVAARLAGKVVFVGVTAQSAARDRLMTPYSYGQTMPGVEIHAHAFETLVRGAFLTPARESTVALFCLLATLAAGFTFVWRSGWQAYAMGAGLVAVAHLVPFGLFTRDVVFPVATPVGAAWLVVAGAATWQHFVVRRLWHRSENERDRYRQAIHFVTHEMRTPLTAIQGSSELMGRYRLSEEKHRQIAGLINSESKRLARMIQTFLDVERLSAGQMELKRESFPVREIVESCVERVRPLAEGKRIALSAEQPPPGLMLGDRELMEYAFYNLLTNAVKYSPTGTEVRVSALRQGQHLRLSVEDQGIGMDEAELKSVFNKFYRTRKAEASGEAGTGIGLSLVDQIVTHHGGRVEVTSEPGKGSCFTLVLPASVPAVTAESR